MNAIEVEHLSKKYGSLQALYDISFSVKQGELFGFIGPDGAGKTTLFRLLTTLINPTSGSARIDGYDIKKDYLSIRKCVGYMPGSFSLYQDLTVQENLFFFASIFGVSVEENYELISPIYSQIEPFKNRRAGQLSGGMKQKLALSCALIHSPKVLFLDEPTTGVDAVSRSEFWDILSNLKSKQITVLVSTPYMDEASRCDRIALCNEGRILSVDTPNEVVSRFKESLYTVKANSMLALLNKVRTHEGIKACYPFGEYHHMVVSEDFDNSKFYEQMKDIEGFVMKKIEPDIEDVFIKLMKDERTHHNSE